MINKIAISLACIGWIAAMAASAYMAYNNEFEAATMFGVWSIVMLILAINSYDDEDFDGYA